MSVVARSAEIVPTGLPFGTVRWGAHLCHFFRTLEDLEEVLVPYFDTGLANREKCVWIAHAPLTAERAKAVLAKRVVDLDAQIASGQIAIFDRDEWHARSGGLPSERRIEHWIERERIALADGYSGLRITGDTAWTESTEWRSLALHEARMHRALDGRRITALCSYPLDRCGPAELIDILRNHKSALLRRDGRWEHVGSTTAALALAIPTAPKSHSVEFFSTEFPANALAQRLIDVLPAKAAIALCTREHLAELRAAIEVRIDPTAVLGEGRLVLLDADMVYAQVIAAVDFDGAVDTIVGGIVRGAVARFGGASIYGELVDVLCRHDRRDLAIRAERWWNAQVAKTPIELHCGYSTKSFTDADSIQDFRNVCDEHGHVVSRSLVGADPERLLAELQQVTSILETESARRAATREHLVILQRVTSALCEAATFDNIGSVVTAELAPSIGATRTALVIGGGLIALRGITTPDDSTVVAQILDHVSPQWTTREEAPPELAWVGGALVGVLPLVFAQERIGTIVLGFDVPSISLAQRTLIDDLVRQVSQSVERARAFEQAEKERVRAERASVAKDEFLAMLGHELRNPLSPILSATQLMRLRAPDQLVKERMTIERNTARMIRLVDDLLDVSQIVRGEVALAREPSELADIVEQALDVARAVIEDRVRFTVAVPAQLVVDVDRARMRQVLANLALNAAKHSSEPVEIVGTLRGESVELVVRDRGDGIDPELLPYVFDLFVQARQGTDRARGGLGVGLAIARSIVELHGGTIGVTSDTRGSAFTITLPRWQIERTTDQIVVPVAAGGRRILVVDDNEDAAWLLAEALHLLGHDVRTAYEGSSALVAARAWSPEIALLDIGLPGMNGFDLCRALRDLPSPPYTIAISGYGQPKDREQARAAGFDAHFVKPVDLRDVQAAIEALASSS